MPAQVVPDQTMPRLSSFYKSHLTSSGNIHAANAFAAARPRMREERSGVSGATRRRAEGDQDEGEGKDEAGHATKHGLSHPLQKKTSKTMADVLTPTLLDCV